MNGVCRSVTGRGVQRPWPRAAPIETARSPRPPRLSGQDDIQDLDLLIDGLKTSDVKFRALFGEVDTGSQPK